MHFGSILGPGALCKVVRVEKCPFSAKIADLQKFRLRNFGRGVSGAHQKNFLNYKYKLLSPKKFSWSYENFKFVSQKSWGREKKGFFFPPPTTKIPISGKLSRNGHGTRMVNLVMATYFAVHDNDNLLCRA